MATKKKKKKPESSPTKFSLKSSLVFELYGLILLAVFLITLSHYGWFGETFSWIFRFLAGTWDFIIPLIGMFYAVYIMVKRKWPVLYSPRWIGLFIIFSSILLFDHIFLFDQLSAQGKFTDQNIVKISWDAILQEKAQLEKGQASTTDIGGGMIGAVGLAVSYYLFARTGTFIIALFTFLIGVMLLFQLSYVNLFAKVKELIVALKDSVVEKVGEVWQLLVEKRSSKESESEYQQNLPKEVHDFQPIELQFSKGKEEHQVERQPVIHDFAEQVYQQEEMDLPPEPVGNPSVERREGTQGGKRA